MLLTQIPCEGNVAYVLLLVILQGMTGKKYGIYPFLLYTYRCHVLCFLARNELWYGRVASMCVL